MNTTISDILNSKREAILQTAEYCFDYITSVDSRVRLDDKIRTGIQVLVRVLNTRDLINAAIQEPSEHAKFFVTEKSVRAESHNHFSSGNTANADEFYFHGCVAVRIAPDIIVHASTSGLKEEEDVAVSIAMLATLLGWSVRQVIENIELYNGCIHPAITDEKNYLHTMLVELPQTA